MGINNIKFDIYKIIKKFGHTTWKILIIYAKSHLMTEKDIKNKNKIYIPQ
jgi:hypothetical protein